MSKKRQTLSFIAGLSIPFILMVLVMVALLLLLAAAFNGTSIFRGWKF